jgi:hypothetical protein
VERPPETELIEQVPEVRVTAVGKLKVILETAWILC